MLLKKVLPLALAGVLLHAGQPFAAETTTLDPVVVTATRLETPLSQVASSVTVISRQDIENQQPSHVIDVLRSVPGLDVVRQGGSGQQTSIFLRGANSTHTLVLVDGVEVNDPSNPGRSFDFANLAVDNIERIEIVRGPGSTLYGSDALGGVINIITRKGSGKPKVAISAEGGSFDTHQERLSLSGGNDLINYSLTASYFDTKGISAAAKKYGNTERDGFDRTTVSTRFGLTPLGNVDVDFFLRYIKSNTDLDTFAGPGGDDPNNTFHSESIYARIQGRLMLLNDLWEQRLGLSLTDYARKNIDRTDPDHPFDSSRTTYDSRLYKMDWQHNLYFTSANVFTLGGEYKKEEAKGKSQFFYEDPLWNTDDSFSKKSVETFSAFLQDQVILWDDFITTFGLRVDDHQTFGARLTYRITSSYLFRPTGTRIKGTFGTAFKAPTLAQLFENSTWVLGNPNLAPEKSRGWDIGLEQKFWDDRISLSATYFENRFEDLINTFFSFSSFKYEYENIDKAESKGVELTASVRPMDNLTLSASYTYTDTENRATGNQLLRRPRHKYNLNADYRFLDRGNVNLDIFYVGKRDDIDLLIWDQTKTLGAYTVVNLAIAYDLAKHLRIHGRVENLFDEDYEEVNGFGTPGIAGYVGATLSF
ncbi:TonB-dependent receptor [Desulfuromonas sp. CSMB_57]|uniref:TonB-dependent receptor plug domain-containing protein n=1 Tax=Desulfuromonas sp. CSMB_57 TaxID=2807629 RepID=UPI001CD58197|nr:TonB-dependent receptor [Desulfuromonas sp. CSMB_57]